MSNKIVLTMIVKNEEHVITRALESCYKMIDSYCIVDTGSTDKTKEVIKDFFDSKKIDGKIVDFEFTNFEECRNKSIEEAKELGDYGFWMDADEVLELNSDFSKSKLTLLFQSTGLCDSYVINCKYNAMNYNRAQFYKFSSDWEWYGPVHEVLRIKEYKTKQIRTGEFNLGNMKIIPDGNSWKGDTSIKYEEHAKILLKYQEDKNWEDPRWTFYLAQSYRDAGQIAISISKNPNDERALKLLKNSINYYKERAKDKSGYWEEVYYSQLMVARLYHNFESDEYCLLELMKCEELNNTNRCEHLFNIISYLQSQNLHRNALEYCKIAMKKLKGGCNASLFKETIVYDWAIYDMYGVSLHNLGQFEESLKYFNYALKKGNEKGSLDPRNRERVENNVKSAKDNIAKRGK